MIPKKDPRKADVDAFFAGETVGEDATPEDIHGTLRRLTDTAGGHAVRYDEGLVMFVATLRTIAAQFDVNASELAKAAIDQEALTYATIAAIAAGWQTANVAAAAYDRVTFDGVDEPMPIGTFAGYDGAGNARVLLGDKSVLEFTASQDIPVGAVVALDGEGVLRHVGGGGPAPEPEPASERVVRYVSRDAFERSGRALDDFAWDAFDITGRLGADDARFRAELLTHALLCEAAGTHRIVSDCTRPPAARVAEACAYGATCKRCGDFNPDTETSADFVCYGCRT